MRIFLVGVDSLDLAHDVRSATKSAVVRGLRGGRAVPRHEVSHDGSVWVLFVRRPRPQNPVNVPSHVGIWHLPEHPERRLLVGRDSGKSEERDDERLHLVVENPEAATRVS